MSHTLDSLDLLREMIRIPSPSFEEGAVSDLLEGTLTKWGMNPERYANNILARCEAFDAQRPTLVLCAHMDTVAPAASYTRDPFDPGNDAGTVYGLGANDDGGSVVSMIAAFRSLSKENLAFNLVLALSCEEERSGPNGARMLFAENGPLCPGKADWVIVGEPTGMRAATSERGLLVLDGLAHGVSGHAARGEGVNALYIALDDIDALRRHVFTRVSPLMGGVKLNVTQINAGTAHNVIPDSCSFVVDIRATEQYTNEEILEELRGICKSELKPRNLLNRSSATYPGSPLLEAAGQFGIETFSSPTTSDWMRTGRDAIKMGPGESSRSHKADEFILVQEVEEAVAKYVEFIKTFSGVIASGKQQK